MKKLLIDKSPRTGHNEKKLYCRRYKTMYYFLLCKGMFNNVVYNSADFNELYDTYSEARAAAMSCSKTDKNLTYFIYQEG